MTASTEVLREELQAAETALADRRSQLNFARLLAEKNTLKAHGYQGELQLEQQQTAELEAAAVGLTEVAQELHMSELLCAEARDSAEDALLIRRQAVSAAQVLLQAHALLSSGRCSKARALEDAQEASEAYLWRRDALRFEEQRAQQLRRVLRSPKPARPPSTNIGICGRNGTTIYTLRIWQRPSHPGFWMKPKSCRINWR